MHSHSDAGPSDCHTTRYVLRSSDVLEDMRINVMHEGSEQVKWYKERFLSDDEILEHVVENATSTLLWTIHRPKRGWYIRVRSPSFPPGVFIALNPVPTTSPYHADGALTFACRTSVPIPPASFPNQHKPARPAAISRLSMDSDVTLTDGRISRDSGSSVHSYPPTPPTGPALVVHPPSPRSVHARLDEVSLAQSQADSDAPQPTPDSPPPPPAAHRKSRKPPTVAATVTHFLLSLHSAEHVPAHAPPQGASFLSRIVSALRTSAPSRAHSFTLSLIPAVAEAEPGRVVPPTPLLTFHDHTPVWTVRETSGLMEMDEPRVRALGVEPSFYVAIALTYLEFLEERESYLVAAND